MRELDYLSLNLLNLGMSQAEVTAFLVVIYNYKLINADIPSQLSYTGNQVYINAYCQFSDEIEILTPNDWK